MDRNEKQLRADDTTGFFEWLDRQGATVAGMDRDDQVELYCETGGGGGMSVADALAART